MPDLPPLTNLYRLYVFRLAARQSSFTAAAEVLHTSQPNVSRHISKLEDELGVALFDRRGGGVAMTDAGRVVFDYAERLLEMVGELDRALNELQGLESGYLRLGASCTPGIYLLPSILAKFRDAHPGLDLTYHLGNSQEIVNRILAGELDLGFVEGYRTLSGMQVQSFMEDELVLIAPPGHPLEAKKDIPVRELAGETIIWREQGSGMRWGMEKLFDELDLQPDRTLEISGCEGVKRAVAAGLGLSVVSRRAVAKELALGELIILEGEGLRRSRQLHIISPKDRRASAAALAFLASIRKQLPAG